MKRNLFAGVVLLVTASIVSAAPIASDNFDDGVLGSQWQAIGAVAESGGTLNMNASNGGEVGVQSASGYVLSGDFDFTVDLNVNSFNVNGGLVFGGVILYSGSNYVSVQHRNQGAGWFEWAFVKGNSVAYNTKNLSGLEDVQYRFQRSGNTVTYYLKAGDNWSAITALGDFGTGDTTIKIYSNAYTAGSSLNMSADNLVVPEPATVSLIALGSMGMMLRKK